MNCPVCNRELPASLSICLTCGAMMNDTVREELASKIERLPRSGPLSEIPSKEPDIEVATVPSSEPGEPELPLTPARPKAITAELKNKNTNPTLVDFRQKGPDLPDWRIELQNAVRKRNGSGTNGTVNSVPSSTQHSAAIRPQAVQNGTTPMAKNERVANALRRIEESKRTYSGPAVAVAAKMNQAARKPVAPQRPVQFNVVPKLPKPPAQPTRSVAANVAMVETLPAPKPVFPAKIPLEKKKFDTNKLPPIPEPETPLIADALDVEISDSVITVERKSDSLRITPNKEKARTQEPEFHEYEEIDDLAPLSMRFGAGLFDLIIGGFAAAILLSPFIVSNTNLATMSGLLAIGGAILVVMFVYQTVTIAFLGRTFGMKLFSIEMIDAEEGELPTLHQAAVNTSVYLLFSILCLGIGLLPVFFNEEHRAFHDMLAGTLIVREEED